MPQSPDIVNAESRRLLEEAGFVWDQEHRVWINRTLRRVLSFESVRDRQVEWVRGWIEGAQAKAETRPKN